MKPSCSVEASNIQLVKIHVQQALESFLYLHSIIWHLFQTSIHSKYTFTLTLELKNDDWKADLRKRSIFSLRKVKYPLEEDRKTKIDLIMLIRSNQLCFVTIFMCTLSVMCYNTWKIWCTALVREYDHVYTRDILFTVDGAEVNYIHVSSFSNFELFAFNIYIYSQGKCTSLSQIYLQVIINFLTLALIQCIFWINWHLKQISNDWMKI